MPRFSDEAWDYIQDCKEKKITGGSARNMKTASDYMTQKELRALDGEVKTYRLGSPMSWEEFNAMPDDLKKMYIKNLRKKFNVPDQALAVNMGVDISKFTECLKAIKLSPHMANDRSWFGTDDSGRFQTWWIVAEEEK